MSVSSIRGPGAIAGRFISLPRADQLEVFLRLAGARGLGPNPYSWYLWKLVPACRPTWRLSATEPAWQRPRTRAVTVTVTVNRPWNLNPSPCHDSMIRRRRAAAAPARAAIVTCNFKSSSCAADRQMPAQARVTLPGTVASAAGAAAVGLSYPARRKASVGTVVRGTGPQLCPNPCCFLVLVPSGSYWRDCHVTLPETWIGRRIGPWQ